MKRTKQDQAFDHSGPTFDSFLEEEGVREKWKQLLSSVSRPGSLSGLCRSSTKQNGPWQENFVQVDLNLIGCWIRGMFLFP